MNRNPLTTVVVPLLLGSMGARSEGCQAETTNAYQQEQQTKPDCLDVPLEQCEASGCKLLLAQPYDAWTDCYTPEPRPAFCEPNPDMACVWQGYPVVLTEPGGSAWYVASSCFSTPGAWSVEYVPEGKKACPLDCLDVSLEQCEASGCQVLFAQPYDLSAGCYAPEARAAFCRPNPDIMCIWAGFPIVLTEPGGSAWYAGSSCFSTPHTWGRQEVPGGKPACE